MKRWLERHAKAIQAGSAMATVLIAVVALIGVKLQIESSAQQQREQSARDIYREFLSVSIAQPDLASPDYCAIAGGPRAPAYENYVQYLIYTSEQVLGAFPGWDDTMEEHLLEHSELLCSGDDWTGDTPEVQSLIKRFRARHCTAFVSQCAKRAGA